MPSETALCRVRIKASRSLESKQTLTDFLTLDDFRSIPHTTIQQWIKSISCMFFERQNLTEHCCIRDWDLVLDLDGSAENIASDQPLSQVERFYSIRYRLPLVIWNKLGSNAERVQRAELFALGSILYELISGGQLFGDIGPGKEHEAEIQNLITMGNFPEDIWTLPLAVRILACWCPAFAKEMLEAHGKDSLPRLAASYIKKHPVIFGLQVLGGVSAIVSIIALSVLGAAGFTAAGPLAGSAAAAWQSSIGVVQSGSIFAWCQSAAMGGAAVGGILATGLGGLGVAVGAVVAGALTNEGVEEIPDLKERFLSAWEKETIERVC